MPLSATFKRIPAARTACAWQSFADTTIAAVAYGASREGHRDRPPRGAWGAAVTAHSGRGAKKRKLGSMKAIHLLPLLCAVSTLALAAGDKVDNAKATIKQDAKEVGHAIARDSKQVGQAVARDSKAVGHAVADKSRQVGHAVAESSREAGHTIAQDSKKVGAAVAHGAQTVGKAAKEDTKKVKATVTSRTTDEPK